MAESQKVVFKKIRGERLDKFLSQSFDAFSREKLKKLIASGSVTVNGKNKKASELLKKGDEVVVYFEKPKDVVLKPNPDLKVKIIAEAPDYVVVEKPADVVTHPSETSKTKSLIEGLLAKYPEIMKVGEDALRPGIVHRLDHGTSGLLVVAKTQKGFTELKKQFQTRTTSKEYTALVFGTMGEKHGNIDLPIVRSRNNPTEWVARPLEKISEKNSKGKVRTASTEYEVMKSFDHFTLLRVTIHTGRTHQIRVHMKAIGHPIVGDDVYTTKEAKRAKVPFKLHRFFLHATKLEFNDPKTGERVMFTSPLPKILKEFLSKLS